MAFLDTLRSFIGTDARTERRVDDRLQDLYRGFLESAERLELTAAEAPVSGAEDELRKIAADHRESAGLIRAELVARGASVPTTIGKVTASIGVNHWSRIVEDLVVLQAAHSEVLDLATDIAEHHPELTALIASLTQRTSDHITRLRGQVARSDPQALN